MVDHQAQRWLDAESTYRRILTDDPQNIDALHFLGVLLFQTSRHVEAGNLISRALLLNANNPPAHHNLGLVLLAQGKKRDAADCFRKALDLAPQYLDALVSLGDTLAALGALEEAAAAYRRAVPIAPGNALIRFNLGNVHFKQGDLPQAAACYREAIRLQPVNPAAHTNLGSVLRERGALDDAIASFEAALNLKSDYTEALYNLAVARRDQGHYGVSIEYLRRLLALRPDFAPAHYCLGQVYTDLDRGALALSSFGRALALDPDYPEARWSMAMTQLPAVYGENEIPHLCRAAFDAELASLERWCDKLNATLGQRAVATQQPFRLAYREEDNRELLQRYGNLCASLMGRWQVEQGLGIAAPRAGGPVRVGIVSQYFRNHSVWNAIVKGWFQQIDRERFALTAFCLNATEDAETRYARSRAARFVQGAGGLRQWVDAILACEPDVLIYPEIGMDPMSLKLASLRLAPLQAASWGHPETTGLPTIDCYLSATDLEPEDAQSRYVERLVALPNLGCYLQPESVDPAPPDCAGLGIEADVPLLLCPGTPFKYAPEHDWVLAEIAHRLGRCQLVFFVYENAALPEKLRARLATVFAGRGLDLDSYVRFIPWQSREGFHGLLSRADVFLDTIGFSGFNTALQAVQCDLPIVTREGRFLRGRLASGILKRIGVPELVAADEEQYIALAVRLIRDPAYRDGIRRRIKDGRPRLYGDTAPIRALESFLAQGA